MGTPSSTHTRMMSWRSSPISFDNSSGVRWFAIGLPPVRTKKPAGATAGRARETVWYCKGGNQRARLPEERMAEEYPAAVTADKNTLPGFDERRLTLKGVDTRFFVGGVDGPPVVLVHRLGGAAAKWGAVAPALAERHRVIVPDLPGHGGSAGVPGLPNLAPFAELVHEIARHEATLPAAVVGHSLGAVVALRHAVRYPDETRGIVLAGAAGIRPT